MSRSDFPQLEAEAHRVKDALKPLMKAYGQRGLCVTIVIANTGEKGGVAYLSTGERDDMISALEELVGNLKLERAARGGRAATFLERHRALEAAAVAVLDTSRPDVSEEEGVRRLQVLADLVGYRERPQRLPGARA